MSLKSGLAVVITAALFVSQLILQIEAQERGSRAAHAMTFDCDPAQLQGAARLACLVKRFEEGRRLFDEETFQGNGRTCVTCHSVETGTFSPRDAQRRLAANAGDPLFVHDGLDDDGVGTSRITRDATVRITLPLPPHVTHATDPTVTHITVNRGTPTTMNTPALDPSLMYDARDADLLVQALGAIHGHAQNTREPTALELELIAEFQRTAPRFFSDAKLRKFARSGVPPTLPQGRTASEKRGRQFFVDAEFQPPSKAGTCALCHSGPMLNRANVFSTAVFGNPPGFPFFSVLVSEANFMNNPTQTFLVHDGLGDPVPVTTPDIGILMTDPATSPMVAQNLPPPDVLQQFGLRLAFFANLFKVPTLWGVKDTAPYFHDNSAKDFDDLLKQYDLFFVTFFGEAMTLTPQDRADIKAFLRLL
jgi:cytochrome c peroxidase